MPLPDIIELDVKFPPLRHSWYHYSCFHHTLTYALTLGSPAALAYIACREAVHELVPADEYPFFTVHDHLGPCPHLSWRFPGEVDSEEICRALGDGIPVIAQRDLFDVAGFPQHFGQSHHPGWYLLYGFDRGRRTFLALAEEGGRDAQLDARRYGRVELTQSETEFYGRRAAAIFGGRGPFPNYPILIAEGRLRPADLLEQEMELRSVLTAGARQADWWQELLYRIKSAEVVDADALVREERAVRVWGRKLRAAQVLGSAEQRYAQLYLPATRAMEKVDLLLAGSIFWQHHARVGPLKRERFRRRQEQVVEALSVMLHAEMDLANLFVC